MYPYFLADRIFQKTYAKGSSERAELTKVLDQMPKSFPVKIPITAEGQVVSAATYILPT